MTATGALARGRKRAKALMVDAGELRGPGTRVLDQTSGQYVTTPGPLKYTGEAKIQTTDTIGHDAGAGERIVVQSRFRVDLPMDAPAAVVDDVFTVTASVNDPQLVGRRFRVASLVHKSYMTARRLAVEEEQS